MEVSKVTSKGQVTIPKTIRERLKLQDGDELAFIEKDGKILITKSSTSALREFLDSMGQEVSEKGISEEDLLHDLEVVREEMWNEKRK